MRDLMQQLGNAVRQSLEGSEPMATALDDIKKAGYAVEFSVDANLCSDEDDDDSAVTASSATSKNASRDLQLSDVATSWAV